jgi:HEAT repeat protein
MPRRAGDDRRGVFHVGGEEPGVETIRRRRKRQAAGFIENLGHPEAVYRWGAAEGLGRLGDPGSAEYVVPLLADSDWRVRLKAAWALGRIGDTKALPALMRLMRDDEREIVQDMAREAVQAIQQRRIRRAGEGG